MDAHQVTRAGHDSAGVIEETKKNKNENGKMGVVAVFGVIALCLAFSMGLAAVQYVPEKLAESDGRNSNAVATEVKDDEAEVDNEEASFNEGISEYNGDEKTEKELEAIAGQAEDEDITYEDEANEGMVIQDASEATRIKFVVSGVRKDNINVGDSFAVKVTTSEVI